MTKICVKVCPTTPPSYADLRKNKCVALCPDWYYAEKIARTCVMDCPASTPFRQNSTRMCVSSCIGEQNSYADNATNFCVARCSFGTWGDPRNQACVQACPSGYFGDNQTNLCVAICPTAYFGDFITKTCVDICPALYIGNDLKRLCESSCPAGTLIELISN